MLIALVSLFALAYISSLIIAVVTLAHQPGFQPASNYDFRHKYGDGTMLVVAKQSVQWEEPEAHIHVFSERRVKTHLGFEVIHM